MDGKDGRQTELARLNGRTHQTQEVKSGALTSLSKGHPEPGRMEAVGLLTKIPSVIFQRILEAIYYSHSQGCSSGIPQCAELASTASLLSLTGEKNKTLFLHTETSGYKPSDKNLSASASPLSPTEAA